MLDLTILLVEAIDKNELSSIDSTRVNQLSDAVLLRKK